MTSAPRRITPSNAVPHVNAPPSSSPAGGIVWTPKVAAASEAFDPASVAHPLSAGVQTHQVALTKPPSLKPGSLNLRWQEGIPQRLLDQHVGRNNHFSTGNSKPQYTRGGRVRWGPMWQKGSAPENRKLHTKQPQPQKSLPCRARGALKEYRYSNMFGNDAQIETECCGS